MNNKTKDIAVIGFALFSMFFGAGNLLFPPHLGLISGEGWITSLIGFILADVGLSLLVILAAAKANGNLDNVLSRAGKTLAKMIGSIAVLCIGPLLAIPRTAATTYEMGILPIIGERGSMIPIIISVVFFAITLALTIRPSKVVDIIGKILTPTLLLCLGILIVMGIINPIGNISPDVMMEKGLFAEGVSQGYLTMDALGASALAAVIIVSIKDRGYRNPKDQVKITVRAGLVAGVSLALVYGGLTYLGSTLSGLNLYDINTSQASLMVIITESLLGKPGKIILGIIVTLACLTTSIGLTSAAGEYFSKTSNGKLKYEYIVIAVCVFSAVVSNFGVSTIIKFSAPILEVVYPVLIALVVISLFTDKIKNDNTFKGCAYITLIVSLLTVANSLWNIAPFMTKLPLASLGFNWAIPAIIGSALGSLIKSKNRITVKKLEID